MGHMYIRETPLEELLDLYYENSIEDRNDYQDVSLEDLHNGVSFEAFAAMQHYPSYWFKIELKKGVTSWWEKEIQKYPIRYRKKKKVIF